MLGVSLKALELFSSNNSPVKNQNDYAKWKEKPKIAVVCLFVCWGVCVFAYLLFQGQCHMVKTVLKRKGKWRYRNVSHVKEEEEEKEKKTGKKTEIQHFEPYYCHWFSCV